VKRFFAVATPGFEAVTAREIAALGGEDVRATRGGVGFAGPLELAFRANLWLRTAAEVRLRLLRFHAPAERLLARRAAEIDWAQYLGADGGPAAIQVSTTRSVLRDERRIAALVREGWPASAPATAPAPALTVADPDAPAGQRIYVRLVQDTCTISIDMSGDGLHRRGYRQEQSRAPLRESLAAALILALEWDPRTPFLDPMCGSGTLPIEAALIALDRAPGLDRRFACEDWPGAGAQTWAALRSEARARIRTTLLASIFGSDRNAGALGVARRNAERAGVVGEIALERRLLADLAPPPHAAPGLVLTNPPYGRRIGDEEDPTAIYAELGRVLGQRFRGWQAGFVGQDPRHARAVGLPVRRKVQFLHGGLRCWLEEVELG
jgi:putative N6-adenine-specific DNA methylase